MQVIGIVFFVGVFLIILGILLEKGVKTGVKIAILIAVAIPILAIVDSLAFAPRRAGKEVAFSTPPDSTSTPTKAVARKATSPAPSNPWRDDVLAAQEITDAAQRRDAMMILVQQALQGTGIQVHVAGDSSPTQIHPDDYQPAPVLNFDVNLNSKRSWAAPSRILSQNVGYCFHYGSTSYAIIGPDALSPSSPVFTQMYTEHEFYHAQHHSGTDTSDADMELETWVHDFRNYFHLLYPYRPQWAPLVDYYEDATPTARRRALDQLVGYYNNAPSPPITIADAQRVRDAFADWLRRRLQDPAHGTMQLIQDLERRLRLGGTGDGGGGRASSRRWDTSRHPTSRHNGCGQAAPLSSNAGRLFYRSRTDKGVPSCSKVKK